MAEVFLKLIYALALTLVIELPVSLFFTKKGKRVPLWCAVGNVLTNPLLNVILTLVWPLGTTAYVSASVILEIGAFLYEDFIYENLAKIPKKSAHLLSLSANALSLSIGLLLSALL